MTIFQMLLFASMLGFFQVFFTWVVRVLFLVAIGKIISKKIETTKGNLTDTINKVKGDLNE